VKKINEEISTLSDANAKDICEIRNCVSEIS
jgi:hypothetical protein